MLTNYDFTYEEYVEVEGLLCHYNMYLTGMRCALQRGGGRKVWLHLSAHFGIGLQKLLEHPIKHQGRFITPWDLFVDFDTPSTVHWSIGPGNSNIALRDLDDYRIHELNDDHVQHNTEGTKVYNVWKYFYDFAQRY